MKLQQYIESLPESGYCVIHRESWVSEITPDRYRFITLSRTEAIEDDNFEGGGVRTFQITPQDMLANDWQEFGGEHWDNT